MSDDAIAMLHFGQIEENGRIFSHESKAIASSVKFSNSEDRPTMRSFPLYKLTNLPSERKVERFCRRKVVQSEYYFLF